jgi:hypothetical protein
LLLGCFWAASGLQLDCGWTAAGHPILLAPAWAPASSFLPAPGAKSSPGFSRHSGFSWASPGLLLDFTWAAMAAFGSSLARPELLLGSSWLLLASAGLWFLWLLLGSLSDSPRPPRARFSLSPSSSPKQSPPRPRGADGASRLPQVRHRRVVLFSCLRPALRTWKALEGEVFHFHTRVRERAAGARPAPADPRNADAC